MNPDITSFCWRAVKRGILSRGQCLVLREMFTEKSSIDECVDFIVKAGLVDDTKAQALKLQMKSAPRKPEPQTGVEIIQDEEVVPEEVRVKDTPWEPDPGLEWFCYLAVSKNLLTKEICLYLIADIEGTTDMLSFAQAVFETGFCPDLNRVQAMTDEALEMWAMGEPPPFSIFHDD